MSVPTFSQGLFVNSWLIRGSRCWRISCCRQIAHSAIYSFNSEFIPGQNMLSVALLRHPSLPMCELCISFFIVDRKDFGTTMRSPLKIKPSYTAISSRTQKNGLTSSGRLCFSFGHPFKMTFFNCCNTGSAWVCCFRFSCHDKDIGRSFTVTTCSNSF